MVRVSKRKFTVWMMMASVFGAVPALADEAAAPTRISHVMVGLSVGGGSAEHKLATELPAADKNESSTSIPIVQGTAQYTQSVAGVPNRDLGMNTFSLLSAQINGGGAIGAGDTKTHSGLLDAKASVVAGIHDSGFGFGFKATGQYSLAPNYIERPNYHAVMGGVAMGLLTPVGKSSLLSVLASAQGGVVDGDAGGRLGLDALFDSPGLRATLAASLGNTHNENHESYGIRGQGENPTIYNLDASVMKKLGPVMIGPYLNVSHESITRVSDAGGWSETETATNKTAGMNAVAAF